MKTSLPRISRLLGLLILPAWPIAAASGQTSRPPTIRLSQELVDFYAGDWIGHGRMTRSGERVESNVTFTPVLRKEALSVHYQGHAERGIEFVGFWSITARLDIVMSITSDDDNGARVFRASGHKGSRLLVFEADSQPHSPPRTRLERFSFERTSKDSFVMTYEYSVDDGNSWVVDFRQDYARKT